jgi:hypothetical protein
VIGDILKKLTDAVLGSNSFLEYSNAIESIKKELGEKHPVLLLVELTSTYQE